MRPGRPPVSDQDRQRQRLDLSRVAVRLFLEQGFAATSGQQIARAAGMSERTLWRLFRRKENCVEPLLTKAIEGLQSALSTWTPEHELSEHLRAKYTFLLDSSAVGDADATLAVVRMTRSEPALRAVWLVLQEQAEPTFAAILGQHLGLPDDAPEIRIYAATLNAALRVATDDFALAATDGISTEDVQRHRKRVAEALRVIARAPIAQGGASFARG